MKKVKFNGKLNLSKERISNLSANQMNNINGGGEVIGAGGSQERPSMILCKSKNGNCETRSCQGTICIPACIGDTHINFDFN